MNVISISKQKIFNASHQVFAYELVFKDSSNRTTSIATHIQETSKLIISSIASKELDKLLGAKTLAFINVNEETLSRGILDVLDKDRFVLNILEDINLTEEVISKIVQYRKRGFRLSLEHFDSSAKMIIKFSRLFNYIDIIKMDLLLSEFENLEKVMKKFKGSRIKLLAQNIESKEDYDDCVEMGFDLFQGYYLDKPDIIQIEGKKEPAQVVIVQLIKIIKDNDATDKLENFIKQHPDLSFKLIQFFNNSKKFDVRIESLTQVITLMGRAKLLRWLIVYLYSEISTNPASKSVLDLAIKRAQRMEKEADFQHKDKAYLAGMFSMLSSIFEENIKDLMQEIDIDNDIKSLVLENRGIFAGSLLRAKEAEKDYLKKVMLENFDKLNPADVISALEDGGVEIDKDKL